MDSLVSTLKVNDIKKLKNNIPKLYKKVENFGEFGGMSPTLVVSILVIYFAILVFIAWRTSRNATTETFLLCCRGGGVVVVVRETVEQAPVCYEYGSVCE